ncbi:MAG: hypothetical protein R3F14_21490 [Polyangiaceae bacterium]
MWGFPAPQGGPVWYILPERAPARASFSAPASVAPPSLPQCDKTLRWAWGFPAPQGGPTWYVAPGAPLSTAPVPEKPKPPRGPRDSLKRRLMLAGSIGLGLCGVGVSFPYVSAAQTYGFDTSWALLTVPVAGPFLAAGFAERVHDPSNSLQVPFLIAGGVVETAFFATLIAGLALPGGDTPAAPTEPSDTRSPAPPTLTFGVAPSVSGDGGGLLFHGTF